jgi:hypothetical protein
VVERPTDDPLPPARPVAYGSPRLPDGQGVPQPATPAAPRWGRLAYWLGLAAIAALIAYGWWHG